VWSTVFEKVRCGCSTVDLSADERAAEKTDHPVTPTPRTPKTIRSAAAPSASVGATRFQRLRSRLAERELLAEAEDSPAPRRQGSALLRASETLFERWHNTGGVEPTKVVEMGEMSQRLIDQLAALTRRIDQFERGG
jgi:hypothetical protein